MTVNTADTTTEDNNQGVSREQALAGWGEPQTLEEKTSAKQERGSYADEGRLPTRAELAADNTDETAKADVKEEPLEDKDEEEPEPLFAIEDPGDYQPQDYGFEVTYFEDDKGEKPKTVKIKSVEQAEELLEKDPNFGSAKNLLDFNRKVTRMESKSEQDKENWQAQKDEFERQSQDDQQRTSTVENLAKEIMYLVGKGKLPQADAQYLQANWSDPEVAKQPGVKEQLALLAYMAKENKARAKAGIAPLSSAVDAYNAMQLETNGTKQAEAEKHADQERKANGARVAGSSPVPGHAAPKGIAVGRVSGRGLANLGNDWS